MRAYSAVQCVGQVGEIGGRDCNFSKWLGQAQLQVLVDGFWKRWVSPVEQLGKELSAGGESQFQGAKVRVCLGKSRGGMETSVAREQWERGRGEEMEAKPSQRPESGQGLAHFFLGLDSVYFKLCRPCDFSYNQSNLYKKIAIENI